MMFCWVRWQGISELITRDGLINVDFADVRTVMSEMGMAMMGTGVATGSGRAAEAAEKAIRSPLLEDVDLQGAKGVLVNITAGLDFTVGEYNQVGDVVSQFASNDATVVIGTVIDSELTDELRVTVVATGIGAGGVAREQLKVVEKAPPKNKDGTPDYGRLDISPTVA